MLGCDHGGEFSETTLAVGPMPPDVELQKTRGEETSMFFFLFFVVFSVFFKVEQCSISSRLVQGNKHYK